MENHYNETFSKNGNQWDFNLYENYWVGGKFEADNLSTGYHGILKQWWEKYRDISEENAVLLVSEGNIVKNSFIDEYPSWTFETTDKYYELQSEPDIIADICLDSSLPEGKFDLVICQATLEHVYNPINAIRNFEISLKPNGILVIHTHPPGFGYHSFPRDYFRFMKDFWYDIPKINDRLDLLELYMLNNQQVFSAYQKKN